MDMDRKILNGDGVTFDRTVGVKPVPGGMVQVQLVPYRGGPSVVLDVESALQLIDDVQSALDSALFWGGDQ